MFLLPARVDAPAGISMSSAPFQAGQCPALPFSLRNKQRNV
jgi:hypothetical protein